MRPAPRAWWPLYLFVAALALVVGPARAASHHAGAAASGANAATLAPADPPGGASPADPPGSAPAEPSPSAAQPGAATSAGPPNPASPAAPGSPASPAALGSASAPPSPAASASSKAATAPPTFDVRLHEKTVFSLRLGHGRDSAADRARAASRALDSALDDPNQSLSRVEEQHGVADIFVGKTFVITLDDDDVAAAGGDTTLHVYAAGIATKIDDSLKAERKRSAIATSVLSLSLLVFSGLLAFLLLGRIGDLSQRARAWVRDNPERIPALRLGRIEVVRPVAVRGAVSVALALAHRIAQFAIVYSWLIFALSRFESTRDYTGKLADFVLTPLSALIGRIGASLPLFVVAAIAAVALGIAVRFVGLFFGGIERGETHVEWLPPELARPTSVLVRAGVVIVSIVLAAPLITGSDEGALSRAGLVALVALGLACTPVLACAAAGVPAVFGRRLKPGDFVEAGGRAGVVREVTLLELVLEDPLGCEVRIPQLLGLWHPTRVLGGGAVAQIDVAVDPHERPAKVEEALVGAAMATCDRARVDLVSLDLDAARWRVTGVPKHGKGAANLADAVAQAIADRGIGLGRGAARGHDGARGPGAG